MSYLDGYSCPRALGVLNKAFALKDVVSIPGLSEWIPSSQASGRRIKMDTDAIKKSRLEFTIKAAPSMDKGTMHGSKKDRFQSSRTNYVRKIAN